jgi:FtsZ-interacting cell division protein ZipA
MEVVLAGAQFFSETQREALALEAVKAIAAVNTLLIALVGLLVTLVFVKANELRKGQKVTHELLEHPEKRLASRATDTDADARGNVSEVSALRDAGRHDQPATDEEHGQDSSSGNVRRGEPRASDDPNPPDSIKDVF